MPTQLATNCFGLAVKGGLSGKSTLKKYLIETEGNTEQQVAQIISGEQPAEG